MRELLLDANILLRYLTGEPADLSDRAADLLKAAGQAGIALILTPITVAEVVYVLARVYGRPREEVGRGIGELIESGLFRVQEEEIVLDALHRYGSTNGLAFADAYLLAAGSARDECGVMTFDQQIVRIADVPVVSGRDDLPG